MATHDHPSHRRTREEVLSTDTAGVPSASTATGSVGHSPRGLGRFCTDKSGSTGSRARRLRHNKTLPRSHRPPTFIRMRVAVDTPDTITADECRQLDEDGYLRVRNLLSPQQVRSVLMAAPDAQPTGLDDERLDCLWHHPRILAYVTHVLEGDFHLQGFDRRVSLVTGRPGRTCAAKLHTDCPPSSVPDLFYECVAIFPLDPFKANNGATRVVPGSHRWSYREASQVPREQEHPDEQRLLGQPGDVFILNGHVLHAAGDNLTGLPRRSIFAFYVRDDAPRYNVLPWPVSDRLLDRLPLEGRHLLRPSGT